MTELCDRKDFVLSGICQSLIRIKINSKSIIVHGTNGVIDIEPTNKNIHVVNIYNTNNASYLPTRIWRNQTTNNINLYLRKITDGAQLSNTETVQLNIEYICYSGDEPSFSQVN